MVKILIIIFMTLGYLSVIFFNVLRIKQTKKVLPKAAYAIYDLNNYDNTIVYLNKHRELNIIKTIILYLITLTLLLSNAFSVLYNYLNNNFSFSEFVMNVIIMLPITFIFLIINIIIDYIKKFKIEDNFNINKSLLKTFIKDKVIITIFSLLATTAIVYIALDFGSSSIDADEDSLSFILMIGLLVIGYFLRRYFNKLIPFPEGSLKAKIEAHAIKHNFKFKNVYITNASKRTSKVNAYFQGFGFFRKIVIYDTLINNFPEDEVLAVFSHEIAHAKNKDVLKMIILTIPLIYGVVYLFHVLFNLEAFYFDFGFLKGNISLTLFTYQALSNFVKIIYSLIQNPLSRKAEYRADRFAALNVGKEEIINALVNLTKKNLSDLNPHPLDVFINYTHPTVLERVNAINEIT